MGDRYPVTPDGRYFVVRGRLWRRTNPALPDARRQELVKELMTARADVARANRAGDDALRKDARRRVDAAKVALGERGPVWWADGAPDYNRRMAVNTPYRGWFERLPAASR
ncbi:MAG: hypothetical protein U0871_14135 [Gemmataceae bacterium]